MAITTLDGLVAGFKPPVAVYKATATGEAAGRLYSYMYTAGTPGAAAQPADGMAGAALTTLVGQIPFPAAVAGQNIYLAGYTNISSVTGGFALYDRLWHNSGIEVTTTTEQAINSVEWPARDRNGSTNGDGVHVAIEVYTATTNGSAVTNTTLSYTNSAGVAGRTGSPLDNFPASAVAGTFVPFRLEAGDVGVRSIQSITLGTSYGAGAIHLVAYRPLMFLSGALANMPITMDAIALGMPRCYDNTVPFICGHLISTAAPSISGSLLWAQG